jgi:N-acetyltransferase
MTNEGDVMSKKRWFDKIELVGELVTLRPLEEKHADALVAAASDGELWNLWFTNIPNADSVDKYIQYALSEQQQERALPFVVVENSTGKVIGSSRYCNADKDNQRLEVGYTWYSKSYQRTRVNSECKMLLLRHAFEYLSVIAVEFRTHWHNHASRAAIARLGAKQDGILRNNQKSSDGAYRDTVVFSIIEQEWLSVKKNLSFRLTS